MSVAQATKVISNQDGKRVHEKRLLVARSHNKSQLYTNTNTGQEIQKEAESMLNTEMEESKSYTSIRIFNKRWWVLCGEQQLSNRKNKTIPVFVRVLIVTVDIKGYFKCSCCFPCRFGFSCQHIGHVASFYGVNFTSFDLKDVDVRYHNSCCLYVATKQEWDEREDHLQSLLTQLRQTQLTVPLAPAFKSFEECCKYAVGKNVSKSMYNNYEAV